MSTVDVAVAYHSGYGHTAKVAEALARGVTLGGKKAVLIDVSAITEAQWLELDAAKAIVFGAPTYMGGASAQFKQFADASSKRWFTQAWKDKFAGGFTCSLSMSGDKYSTLMYLVTLAMQHSMVWIGTGMLPSAIPGAADQMNRIGSSIGVMAQADNVPAEQSPPKGDLDTAQAYGERIARRID
ncbi:MAG: flavodoxin family protein [Betaproteobacteria bacterium]|nr:flavodoxin family protein [Betaproteobacteria bacterium]